MKKENIINLIKYHVDKDEFSFRNVALSIAEDFSRNGDNEICDYIRSLVSTTVFAVPQRSLKNLQYLTNVSTQTSSLYLPEIIKDDIIGIINCVENKTEINKILFYGEPGTGKTECCKQIARILGRELLFVETEKLIDSRMGETAKNVSLLFEEIKRLPSRNIMIVFDELDSLVMNRTSTNDLREMGRVTSTFLRELDKFSKDILLICTTNLYTEIDKALLRRFDYKVSFNRYKKSDLIEISCKLLIDELKKYENYNSDIKIFKKMLKNCQKIPYPAEMKQILKVSLAFSDNNDSFSYFRRIFVSLFGQIYDIEKLNSMGFTTRESEILTRMSKSTISRKLRM